MRRLVLCVIVLIAIFAIIRSYTEQAPAAGAPQRAVELSPGLVEVAEGKGAISLAFGLMGSGSGDRWSVLPLRILYTSGDTSLSIGLNGLTFLLSGGVRVGRPVLVDRASSGDVVSIGGKVTVNERVEGDVWAFGADIALGAKADVAGNVVSVGGKVTADPRARAKGGIHALPRLKLPFMQVLSTPASASAVELVRELLIFLVAALLLFICTYFMTPHLAGISRSATVEWRRAGLSIVLSAILVPILVVLLVVSILGIFFLPFLFLAMLVAAFFGFFALCLRLGGLLRGGLQDSSLFLFTSGALGLFLVKAPAFAGIALSLLRFPAAGLVGEILRIVSRGLLIAFLVYGFGSTLSYVRILAKGKG